MKNRFLVSVPHFIPIGPCACDDIDLPPLLAHTVSGGGAPIWAIAADPSPFTNIIYISSALAPCLKCGSSTIIFIVFFIIFIFYVCYYHYSVVKRNKYPFQRSTHPTNMSWIQQLHYKLPVFFSNGFFHHRPRFSFHYMPPALFGLLPLLVLAECA